ncbi:hypothetical protein KCP69_15390 [Salmonella enterica subsp. enterica]|nr:hypothetical protein KCP69_15390 [Salmonella enterica subsp. enterica]
MELASWRNDLTLWPGAGDAVLYRSNAGWAFTDAFTSLWRFCGCAFPPVFRRTPWPGSRIGRVRAGERTNLVLSFQRYYLGSSIAGTLGGVFWHSYGWNGVGGFIALMLVLAICGRDAVTSSSSRPRKK